MSLMGYFVHDYFAPSSADLNGTTIWVEINDGPRCQHNSLSENISQTLVDLGKVAPTVGSHGYHESKDACPPWLPTHCNIAVVLYWE